MLYNGKAGTMKEFLFTSESVTEGHPDKMADMISDSILDAYLEQDPHSRVACETMLTRGMVFVSGEVTSNANVDAQSVVRNTIKKIGYTDANIGFDYENCAVVVAIQKQSPDIAQGVDTGGAGDQGMMFGFACDETDTLMPLPVYLSHKLAIRLTEVRRNGIIDYLRPDGKTQVTVLYEDWIPKKITHVVVSAHHAKGVDIKKVRKDIMEHVIFHVLPKDMYDEGLVIYINPTGKFEIGGPNADTGLTGRKIIVDTYGGMGRHGGGAFSGKDPSKVDRSGAYFARYIAKNIVAAGLAGKCEVQLAYAIGVEEPVSIMVDTFKTGAVPEEDIVEAVKEVFDARPRAIIKDLDLLRPIYALTSAYGHFGRDMLEFSWERTDKAAILKKKLLSKAK